MNLVDLALRRRVTVVMCTLAVVLFGWVAFSRLPVSLLPELTYPSLTVETRYPGAAPGEVESLVTRPIEEVVGVVAGVRRLTSISKPGLSQVTLELAWGRDMDFAALDVRQKLDLARLPREASRPIVLRFDPADDPVLRLSVTGAADLFRLRWVAEEILEKDLESTDGVAAVQVEGGYEEEVLVLVDQEKLALFGLDLETVRARLEAENVNQAGGSLYEAEARYLVRSRNELDGERGVLETVIVSRQGRAVKVADVASVVRGPKRREVITRLGGREAVEMAFYKEGDANTVTVVDALRARIDELRKELPPGVEVVIGADQSAFIRSSIEDVLQNAVIGSLLSVIVLLFFLENLAATLAIAVAIPISIVSTFFLMFQTGTTMNVISLGGLALGVGMMVDGSIVVLEAIYKRFEAGENALDAARNGAREVAAAVIGSILTTVVVFVPVIFLEGVAAQLFRDMALTVCFSLMASLVVSLTLLPMLAAFLLGRQAAGAIEGSTNPATSVLATLRSLIARGYAVVLRAAAPLAGSFRALWERVERSYPRFLAWSLEHRVGVLWIALALFALSVLAAPLIGLDLVPSLAQNELEVQVELAPGASLEATDRLLREMQGELAREPAIETVSSIAGGAGLSLTKTGNEGENVGQLQVRLRADAEPGAEAAVLTRLRAAVARTSGVRTRIGRPEFFSFRKPIEIEVYSDDLEVLARAAGEIAAGIGNLPGLTEIETSLTGGNPEVRLELNRDKMALLDLDLATVAETVRAKIQGSLATRLLERDREIDVLVASFQPGEAAVADLDRIIVAERGGAPILLASIARIVPATGPAEIRRIGQRRAAVVSADLDGIDTAAAAASIRAWLAKNPLPAGSLAGLSGQEEEMARASRSMLLACALAIFLVYLVMAAEFESLVQPFVILFTLPLGAIGVVAGLLLAGRSLDVVGMIGIILLAGIVVDNAIVFIDAFNQIRERGVGVDQALLEAARHRLRPIAMTSATTVLGLLPLAFGVGEGAELRAPLAITGIGGIVIATLLTLIVIPVLISLLGRNAPSS